MSNEAYLAALKAVNTWYENETARIAEEPARRLVREVTHALEVFAAAAESGERERAERAEIRVAVLEVVLETVRDWAWHWPKGNPRDTVIAAIDAALEARDA